MRIMTRRGVLGLMLIAAGCGPTKPAAWYRSIDAEPTSKPAVDEDGRPVFADDFADRDFVRLLSTEDAFRILLNTDIFADRHVGYAGAKSIQFEAFEVLRDRPDARKVFADLLYRAHVAGRLYALCAIYTLVPADFKAAERRVLASLAPNETVSRFQNCLIMPEPVRDIIRSSLPGAVRMRPGETLDAAQQRVKGDNVTYDIAGGAYPYQFFKAE